MRQADQVTVTDDTVGDLGVPRDWLLQRIVEESPDAIIFADREGVIRLWNKGAAAMFGYTEKEAVGQTLDFIIPERLRERHWRGYRGAMSTGVTRYGRELLAVPATRKDGSQISIEFTISLLTDDAGQLIGAAAIIRDVTARWRETKAFKERLATAERQSSQRPGVFLCDR